LGRLRVLSGKQACHILSRYGFIEVRRRGSHIVMQKRLPNTTVTVPVPNHSELKIGTLGTLQEGHKSSLHFSVGAALAAHGFTLCG